MVHELIRHILESIFVTGAISFIMCTIEITKFLVETLLGVGTLLVALFAYRQVKINNKLIKKINSKEHELSESMKYELIEMIAILRAIDQKAAFNLERKGKIDYSPEIKRLKELQAKPGFLIFLNSISDDYQKGRVTECSWVEHIIAVLCDWLLPSVTDDEEDIEGIRLIVHEIIDILLNKHADLKGQFGVEYEELLFSICSLKGGYSQFDYVGAEEIADKKMKNRNFLHYLIENRKIQDPNVLLWHGRSQLFKFEGEADIKNALDNGADEAVKIDDVIKKYEKEHSEYDEMMKLNKFFSYLIYNKKIEDSKVLLCYGRTMPWTYLVKLYENQAKGKGADLNIKVEDMITKYHKEYKEFEKRYDNGNK